jgi:hypothetical protein
VDRYLDAAVRLHQYVVAAHWRDGRLVGPDPGIRFNARVGRFIKSYLPMLSWSDQLTYVQAQCYWIMDNWLLHDQTGDDHYRELAIEATQSLVAAQNPEGYWPYPNPEWADRIATVEGCFGALGLLETYSRVAEPALLEGAIAWYRYIDGEIGFRRQASEGMLAVNYFAHSTGDGGGVPNNSTLLLWLLARLYESTRDDGYLEYAAPMARWLAHVQVESGELPYKVGKGTSDGQLHFLCHQYNAFEFVDLVHYQRITADESVLPMMEQLAGYLATGITGQGYARYDCENDKTEVVYYTAAVAQALSQATALGFGDYAGLAERAYGRVLKLQRPDGGFPFHSRRNYGFLSDRRSYPRYLSMILHHFLLEHRADARRGAEG